MGTFTRLLSARRTPVAWFPLVRGGTANTEELVVALDAFLFQRGLSRADLAEDDVWIDLVYLEPGAGGCGRRLMMADIDRQPSSTAATEREGCPSEDSVTADGQPITAHRSAICGPAPDRRARLGTACHRYGGRMGAVVMLHIAGRVGWALAIIAVSGRRPRRAARYFRFPTVGGSWPYGWNRPVV